METARDVTRQEILAMLALILRRPVAVQENPSRSTVPEWDSLKHIELMFLLEDHFGIRFSQDEMSRMDDVSGILRVVEARIGDRTVKAAVKAWEQKGAA